MKCIWWLEYIWERFTKQWVIGVNWSGSVKKELMDRTDHSMEIRFVEWLAVESVVCVADIIGRVKMLEDPPFRPTMPSYTEVLFVGQYYQLMERCWSEEPNTRPNFKHIIDNLRTFAAHRSYLYWIVIADWWVFFHQTVIVHARTRTATVAQYG